ncbi:MAG: hypothetical protein LBS29_04080 [Endomicrobium sp.]|jgi:hypothetical protein|nr:hypothetical protein [Endomicrobium sp.]
MNLKAKILGYFKEHWKAHLFLKSISILVSACLILNIINLPAFADTDEELRKKAFDAQRTRQDVMYQGDASYNSVAVMNNLQDNVKIDKKTNNVFVKNSSSGKYELKGYLSDQKDENGRRKVMVSKGEGGFQEDQGLTDIVDNKLNNRPSSRQNRQPVQDSHTQGKQLTNQEADSPATDAQSQTQEEAETKAQTQTQGERKEGQTQTSQGQGKPEQQVPQTQQETQADRSQQAPETQQVPQEQQQTSQDANNPTQEVVQSQTRPERQHVNEASGEQSQLEQTADAQQTPSVENSTTSTTTSETVRKIAETLKENGEENKDQAAVVEEIARQTGLSREEVEAEFAKLDDVQRKGVIAALANLFGEGKDIVYCVADVLGTVLDATSKGLLAFQAILADAIAGIFVKNNQDLIAGNSSQLMLSAQAIQTVLAKYGKDYVGRDTNVDDIIKGLNAGESAIVHVGGNHFITITKNKDGTFTKTDINKAAETLTADELKSSMQAQYGLKENETTTVLVKKDNDSFKGIKKVNNLDKVLGAEVKWDNSKFDNKSQQDYYKAYGEKSYEMLMMKLYGTTTLTPEQSREFTAFYKEFLTKTILELDKKAQEGSDEDKERVKALKTQAAKELAITNAVDECLKANRDGVISGQIGQVLLTNKRAYPSVGQGFQEGEYYQVINFYADDLKEQYSIKDTDGRTVSVEQYRISTGSSISTREGVTITRSDGSKYQVFGLPGKFDGMNVCFEYMVAYNADGTFFMHDKANIYLLNDTDRVYQRRREEGSKPPTSGMYKGAAPERQNWTHGLIKETETGYIISGTGSRITVKNTSRGWEADAIGIGTEAMAGSTLRMAANDPNGVPATIFLDIKDGFMVYAGNYWVPSDGFIWQYNASVTEEQVKQFIKNTITTQLGSNAEGIEDIDLTAPDGSDYFEKTMSYDEWYNFYLQKFKKEHPTMYKLLLDDDCVDLASGGLVQNTEKDRKKKYQEYVSDHKKNHKDFKTTKMLGAPFSTAAIFKSMGITAKISTKAGFTYDATKSDGDIYKITVDSPTTLELKLDENDSLVILATENINIKITIVENGWALDSGGKTLSGTINKGQVFSFATLLYNTGKQLVNTKEIEMITGYEITGQDEKGNNYYDYTKPKYSKLSAGAFKVKGNSSGKYALVNNLHISVENGHWNIVSESEYISKNENKAIWKAGAEITIAKNDNSFNISITKGDLEVTNLTVTYYKDPNPGEGDDSGEKYKGPTIQGAYIVDHRDLGNNMHSYKIQSGTFKGVSGDQATQNMLGSFMFVPGSDFKKGSIIQPDGTKAKYDSRIKDDGSIDAYGAKWYEKLWDGFVGFFSILAMALMTIFTLGALIWAKDMKGMAWAKEWAAITYGYWNNVEADGSNADAVKRGMDLALSGLAAVAILVIAAVSIVSAIFTGGASIAAGIAAIVAIGGAIAGAVSAINLTYSAIQAFRAGKAGMGCLMLFFALLTVVLTAVGAGQVGSAISSGLMTLGKQFLIKMAIGAAIGAVAGAAVSAAAQGISYAIRKSQGKVDEFDWAEFGKEVGIGALTGAFAGAAVGAQVATVIAKNVAKGVAMQVAKGLSDDVAEKVGAEVAEEVSKEISKQVSKELAEEGSKLVSKEVAKEAGEEVAKSMAKEISKDVSAQIAGSLTKAVSFEIAEEVGENVAKEVGEEVAKNIVDDLAASVASNVEAKVIQALSGKVSKAAAEKIAKSVANKVAASLSKSLMSNLTGNVAKMTTGQIVKEMFLGGTSFARQAGQTTLQFAGQCIKSGFSVVVRVGMQALSGYISYMSARSFVDSVESGDIAGAMKAMYTLVSINIVMPLMSAQSAIKEGGTLKASDLAKESSQASEGITTITVHGMSLGAKIGSTVATTVVGAGIGMALAAIIAKVNGREVGPGELIVGAAVGGALGLGLGALATRADWTSLGNSVKTSFAKTIAPFGGKTAQFTTGQSGALVANWSKFNGATMARAWGGLVGGAGIGVALGAAIWAAKGQKKEDMARYLIIGGVAGGVLGAGVGNAFSTGAYRQAWQNFKANPASLGTQFKQYIQESFSKTLMMVHDFNTYMAYTTGILNQIYSAITGGDSLANTEVVKFINNVTGMGLFKSEADKEADAEQERKKKKAEKKGEEFEEEPIVYKAEFGKKEANAVINQNWESLTGPMMYAGNFVGGILKPVLGPALQHSPILGSIMGVMESAGQLSIMQQHKTVSMLYNMGIKVRLLNIISKQVFDDPNSDEDDQFAELMGSAFMQMFEAMPAQEQLQGEKFLSSSKNITLKDGTTATLNEALKNSINEIKTSNTQDFGKNLQTVCENLGLNYDVVAQYIKPGMSYEQITNALLTEYALRDFVVNKTSSEQIEKLRANLSKIIATSPVMKQSSGFFEADVLNSISAKINYLDFCAKALELNIEGREDLIDALSNGTLTKAQCTKILQARDAKEAGSGARLLMNYISGINSINKPVNDIIASVLEYNEALTNNLEGLNYEIALTQAIKNNISTTLKSLKALNLSEAQINKVIEVALKEGAFGADNNLTEQAMNQIKDALGNKGEDIRVFVKIIDSIEAAISTAKEQVATTPPQDIGFVKAELERAQQDINKAEKELNTAQKELDLVKNAEKELPIQRQKLESLKPEQKEEIDSTKKEIQGLEEIVSKADVTKLQDTVNSKKSDLEKAEYKFNNDTSATPLKAYINAFESLYSTGYPIICSYMMSVLKTSFASKESFTTKDLVKSIERQSVRAQSYSSYTSYRNNGEIQDAAKIEELRKLKVEVGEEKFDQNKASELKMLEAKYISAQIELNIEISNILKDVDSGKLSYEDFHKIINTSDSLYSRTTTLEERTKLDKYRTKVQELAVDVGEAIKSSLENGSISKEDISMLKAIREKNSGFAKDRGNVSTLLTVNAQELSLLNNIRLKDMVPIVTSDGKFLTFDTSGKAEINSVLKSLDGVNLTEGQINKITETLTARGAVDANNKITEEGMRDLTNILKSEGLLPFANTILGVVEPAIRTGKDVITVDRVEITEKGMKLNLEVNGVKYDNAVLQGNLDALANNKEFTQQIIDKYPNALALESALNTALPPAVKTTLKSLKALNLSEAQINKVIEVALKEGAFGADNNLTAQVQKAIQEIVGTKEGADLVVENIESTKLNLKAKLQNILSTSDALVSGTGSFRLNADGKQIENKGYILSSLAKSEIYKLIDVDNAKAVIDSVEVQLNTERIVNRTESFKANPKQLIQQMSSGADPTAISKLFAGVTPDFVSRENGVEVDMSLMDLMGLEANCKDGAAKTMIDIVKEYAKELKDLTPEEKIETLSKNQELQSTLKQFLKDGVEDSVVKDIIKQAVNDVNEYNISKDFTDKFDIAKIKNYVLDKIQTSLDKNIPKDDIVADTTIKEFFDKSGFTAVDALQARLKLLTPENLETLQKKFYGEKGFIKKAQNYIKDNSFTEVVGTKKLTKFNPGVIDKLSTDAMEIYKNNPSEAMNFIRTIANELLKLNVGYGLRSSQLELTTTLQNDSNAALGMGGGKTISLAFDAFIQRVLMGKAANLEILVGNSDLDNYVSTRSPARAFLEAAGMKVISCKEFKPEGGDTDIRKLTQAYYDPNTVVIMDPTMRGHMMNEAISKGGQAGKIFREALSSVNRVGADEVHLWALTQMAAVIGGDNRPPDRKILKNALSISNIINAGDIFEKIAKDSTKVGIDKAVPVTIQNQEVKVVRFNSMKEYTTAINNKALEGEYISVIGQQSSSLQIKMSNGIRDIILNKIGTSAPEGYTPAGMLDSMLKGLFANRDNGGMALGSDGKVKPVGAKGIEESMVIGDIYRQLGFSLREGFGQHVTDMAMEEHMSKTTQMSSTSMQTSLASIYSGANARMVGISGTIAGLQQLIINRTGSSKIHNITGESVETGMFQGVIEVSVKNPTGTLVEKITNTLEKIKVGDLNAAKDLDNILLLAKTQSTIQNFRDAVCQAIEYFGRDLIGGNPKTISPKDALSKGLSELKNLNVELFEFTDNQGKWTNIEKEEDGKYTITVDKNLGNEMGSIADVAKNKNIHRIVIANEMGATGVDYQGNYLNVVADPHLMSNTDMAQALKRSARPNQYFNTQDNIDGASARWATERFLMYDPANVENTLAEFAANPAFVNYARELWNGNAANGNMTDLKSIEWLNIMESGNFDINNPKVIEALYRLSSVGKNATNVDIADSKVKEFAMKEVLTFLSKIQDLKSVDASTRFAIQDSVRDRMVLSVLRDTVAALPEGKAKQAAMAELNDALKNNSSTSKDIFEFNENMKAESREEVMRKTIDNCVQEAQQRVSRLQEVLSKFSSDSKVADQLKIMGNHLDSIRIAMSNEAYYGSKPITDKGLSNAIDMTEFVQIVRSFEDYIMPMATVVDRAETIKTESSIQDNTSRAVIDYVKNDNTLSKPNEQGERVLTQKGELFVKMMQQELNKSTTKTDSTVALAWLANKLGSSYTPLTADLNLAEQTKRQIENVKNLVDKLVEVNKDMKYEAVKEFFILQQDEKHINKVYNREEIIKILNTVNKEYIAELAKISGLNSEISELQKKISGNNDSIPDLEQKIAKLEQELDNYSDIADEGGLGDEMNNIESNMLDMKNILKAKQDLQKVQSQLDEQPKLFKEVGHDIELTAGANVENLIISSMQNRVQADLDKDSSLSKTDKYGKKVLTQKGRIYAKISKDFVEGNSKFENFLQNGPLSKLGFADKIKDNMQANNGEIKYDEKLIKEITNALWDANIWDYSKVEKLYGFYELVPENQRDVLNNMSLAELKGILSAQHSQTIKGLAEQKEYTLPDAQTVALAKLTKSMKFEGNKALGDYFANIVKSYEDLETSAPKMAQINNDASETSKAASSMPGWLKTAGSTIGVTWQYFTDTKGDLSSVSESVDISLEDAVNIVGKDREKTANLLYFAGKVDSTTQEALDNFDTLVKNIKPEQTNKCFESHTNWKKVGATVGVVFLGILGVGLAVGAIVGMAFAGPAIVAALGITVAALTASGIGAGVGFGVVAGIGALLAKFSVFSKIKNLIPSGDYNKKLKISDINKFAKLKTFSKLVLDGKINLANQEDMGNITSKSLYNALNASKSYGQVISDEEAYLILGDNYRHIKVFKEDQIEERAEQLLKDESFKEGFNMQENLNEKAKQLARDDTFKRKNKQEEGETQEAYNTRLENLAMRELKGQKDYNKKLENAAKSKATKEFRWNIASIGKMMDTLNYVEDTTKQEKLFVVLLGDANIDSRELVDRYQKVVDIKDIVDSSVDISVLQEYEMFNADNSVSNEFVSKYVSPELVLKSVDNKFKNIDYQGVNAGEQLVGKMGIGFTKAEEFSIAIAQALVLFENTASMQEYLGLDISKAHTKEEIVSAAFSTYKEALNLFAEGEIDQTMLNQETTIIRTVSEMLMIAIDKPELTAAINETNINEVALNKIERIVNIDATKVNRYVFVNTLRDEVKASTSNDTVFEIKIDDLKKGLESKDALRNIELPKNLNDILPSLESGHRGKKHHTMLMEIRNVKAVSQAA